MRINVGSDLVRRVMFLYSFPSCPGLWRRDCVAFLLGIALASVAVRCAVAEVPEFEVSDGVVKIAGVGRTNPIIYDNDWWFDVFDNNYLWAQASLGQVDLRGNIVSRDMWNWQSGYQYSMQQSVDDANKALKLARDSGLKNIPDITLGSDKALERPASGRVEDTVASPTKGSKLIVAEALKASPDKPLLIISGGPMTTIANALLTNPEIAPNVIVFGLTVNGGYNGKDGWSVFVVTQRAKYVDWGAGEFWDKDSVLRSEHFDSLVDNDFTRDMKQFIKTDLGRANQLGDGAPLFWLNQPKCWQNAIVYDTSFENDSVQFTPSQQRKLGSILVVPKEDTDLEACRDEFFRVLKNPKIFR